MSYNKEEHAPNRVMIVKSLLLFTLLLSLFGCYAGTVKPLLDHPDYKSENEPIRTLRIYLITDNTYKRDKIEEFVSKCSKLIEIQVGIKLEIVNWYQVQWENELHDISKMEMRIAGDTWSKREKFDIAVAFVYFVRRIDGTKLQVGAIDTYFWRYILIRELDPFVLLHELFHAFLSEKGHSEEWAMRAVRHSYGSEWYWLTPEERKEVLRNKWRNFNLTPSTAEEDGIKRQSLFYNDIGLTLLQKREYDQAVLLFNKSLEINPNYAEAYNNLAWFLATAEETDFRDGGKAVELALKACAFSDWRNPYYLETLAAAYARVGDFSNAIEWQGKALKALKPSENDFKTIAQQRLILYWAHKPWPPDEAN